MCIRHLKGCIKMAYKGLTKEKLEKDIKAALSLLYAHDGSLIEKDVNERCLSARLCAYLVQLTCFDTAYNGLDWDPEYNRVGEAIHVKRLGTHAIIPDIILHQRFTHANNICVIEFKKRSVDTACICNDLTKCGKLTDSTKLSYLTDNETEFKYRYGLHIVLNKDSPKLGWYCAGKPLGK